VLFVCHGEQNRKKFDNTGKKNEQKLLSSTNKMRATVEEITRSVFVEAIAIQFQILKLPKVARCVFLARFENLSTVQH
jgi:hypothetical protein